MAVETVGSGRNRGATGRARWLAQRFWLQILPHGALRTLVPPLRVLLLLMLSSLSTAPATRAQSGLQDKVGVAAHGKSDESAVRAEPTAERVVGERSRETGSDVGLDRLLKLPSGMHFESARRAGVTQEEWRTRFREGRLQLGQAREALEKSERQLDELASTGGGAQWQVAPPGSNQTETSPLSFKLREEIRSGRTRVEQAERHIRELDVEADLAGVPSVWRHDPDRGVPKGGRTRR